VSYFVSVPYIYGVTPTVGHWLTPRTVLVFGESLGNGSDIYNVTFCQFSAAIQWQNRTAVQVTVPPSGTFDGTCTVTVMSVTAQTSVLPNAFLFPCGTYNGRIPACFNSRMSDIASVITRVFPLRVRFDQPTLLYVEGECLTLDRDPDLFSATVGGVPATILWQNSTRVTLLTGVFKGGVGWLANASGPVVLQSAMLGATVSNGVGVGGNSFYIGTYISVAIRVCV